MAIVLDGTTGITTPDLTDTSLTSGRVVYAGASGNLTGSTALTFDGTNLSTTNNVSVPNTFGFKNRIINGAMVIDQRNAGASVSVTDSNQYTLDRWQGVSSTSSSKFTVQQSSTAPSGFSNSILVTSSSAYSIGGGDYFLVRQKIEGFNTFDLGWGTANAVTVTLSFWVRSSLTGTFGGAVTNSANSYAYPFVYTINAANTFEQKTITISGPTAGTWIGATNGIGLQVKFGLGIGTTYSGTAGAWSAADYASAIGATSVVGTSGATWYITGVQLEKGSTATSFDVRPFGTELALCQRYANSTFPIGTAWATAAGRAGDIEFLSSGTSSRIYVNYVFPTTMRATPTVIYYNPTNNNTNFYSWSSASDASAAGSFGNSSSKGQMIVSASNAPATDATFGIHVSFSAEL